MCVIIKTTTIIYSPKKVFITHDSEIIYFCYMLLITLRSDHFEYQFLGQCLSWCQTWSSFALVRYQHSFTVGNLGRLQHSPGIVMPPITLISGTMWCINISSQKIWGLSAPLTLTREVRPSWWIPAYTMPLPSLKTIMFRNTITFIITQILEHPSALNKQDSSEKITFLHHAHLLQTSSWHHQSCSARRCAMRMLVRTGRLIWRPTWHRRLITVWEEIHLSLGIRQAVEDAVLNLSQRCINRMYQSWAEMVALGRSDLGRSRVLPVL